MAAAAAAAAAMAAVARAQPARLLPHPRSAIANHRLHDKPTMINWSNGCGRLQLVKFLHYTNFSFIIKSAATFVGQPTVLSPLTDDNIEPTSSSCLPPMAPITHISALAHVAHTEISLKSAQFVSTSERSADADAHLSRLLHTSSRHYAFKLNILKSIPTDVLLKQLTKLVAPIFSPQRSTQQDHIRALALDHATCAD